MTMNREKILSLHSKYNPQGEANRYVNSLSLNESTRFFVLIEPGLGYMLAPLKKKFPGAKMIVLHAGKYPCVTENANALTPPETPDAEWRAAEGSSVQDFLEAEIGDSQAGEIQLVEWRPALSVFGEDYLALVRETADFIKRSDANARTIIAFGPRWFRNFFKNLELIKEVIYLPPGNSFPLPLPLLVTGAGPGLEDVIPVIKNELKRNRLFIVAASSSHAALEAAGIRPGMVISTDGSNWAKYHLHGLFRSKYKFPLAVTLTAALPSQAELPFLIISDGSLWQTLILNKLNIPFIALPQRGTVTATALDLAFALSPDKIFIAGMDLANRDIRSHARPYGFDLLMEEKAGRMNPVYSQSYSRSSALKTGGSYAVYASWFRKQLTIYPRPLYPVGNNNSVFSSMKTTICSGEFNAKTGLDGNSGKVHANFKSVTMNFDGSPSRTAFAVLESALKDPGISPTLGNELSSLLLPNRNETSHSCLIDTIRSLAGFARF